MHANRWPQWAFAPVFIAINALLVCQNAVGFTQSAAAGANGPAGGPAGSAPSLVGTPPPVLATPASVSVAPRAPTGSGASMVTPDAPGAGTPRPGEPVTLDFVNAEIEAVARAIGVMNGRTMVIDPRVKGVVTITTVRPVKPQVAFEQFLATIRLQGFTVVESGGLYKVVPEADAKLQSAAVSVGATAPSGGQLVTQIFPLNFENANNLIPVLRPLISPNNTVNVNPGTNALVITDYADNLQRIARIVAALDVSNASDVEVIPLRHAIASDLVPLLTRLLEGGGSSAVGAAPAAGAGQADTSFRTTLLAEPRSNAIILRAANPARIALVKNLVARLDQAPGGSNNAAGNIYVVHLKNADATKLAITLRAALAADARSGAAGASTGLPAVATPIVSTPTPVGGTGAATTLGATAVSAQPSTGGQIQADPATNTLIITAPEPQYRQLRAVIEMLDARRAQVFVESLIAEVSADKAAEMGVQWQGPISSSGGGAVGLLGTNFSVGGANIISLATGAASGTAVPSTGANFGVAQRVNGVYVLGFLARFLESSGDGNVLSTPNLLTLDNEEAKIVVGENRPFVTGQFTNTGTTGSTVNPFQTIERKDVGLTLRVKPQISENGTIKMQVFQEVSSVQPSTVNDSKGPTTNKRSIESTVLVEDGGVVVLGGLLQDEFSGNQEKVPGLGDIPFLGNLFKSQARSRKKTNLMVFLRPVVLRDGNATDGLTMNRYEQMRGIQTQMQPTATGSLPIEGAGLLPPVGAQAPARTPVAPGAVTPTKP